MNKKSNSLSNSPSHFFMPFFVACILLFNLNALSDETTNKNNTEQLIFTELDANQAKDAYTRSKNSIENFNQNIEVLYANNIKAWNTLIALQAENQELKSKLSTLQDAVNQINNNLYQMQQRLEAQKK